MLKKRLEWDVAQPVPMIYFTPTSFTARGLRVFTTITPINFHFPDGHNILIPSNTLTNFASVPPFLRRFIDPLDDRLRNGTLIHDFLVYEFKSLLKNFPDQFPNPERQLHISWRNAAKIMRKVNALNGYHYIPNFIMYRAVRYWGDVK